MLAARAPLALQDFVEFESWISIRLPNAYQVAWICAVIPKEAGPQHHDAFSSEGWLSALADNRVKTMFEFMHHVLMLRTMLLRGGADGYSPTRPPRQSSLAERYGAHGYSPTRP